MTIANKTTLTAPVPMGLMRMSCPTEVITYRSIGNESVCTVNLTAGVQQLIGLDASKGDFLDIDSIINQTTVRHDLSDVGRYVTSVISAAGTTLYFDPTGSGHGTVPFAVLQGMSTTVAALVADGGLQYDMSQISMTPAYNAPLNLRPDGQTTVMLRPVVAGIAPQILNGFDPLKSDVLNLGAILGKTSASFDLSNVANYVSAATAGGNTTLSVTSGGVTKAFAVLTGVTTTVAQLMADNALVYTPVDTGHSGNGGGGVNFRSVGPEIISVQPIAHGVQQYTHFDTSQGDSLDINMIVRNSAMRADMSDATRYITATTSAAGTTLSFDATGTGGAGTPFAVLLGVNTSVAQLVAAGGLQYDIAQISVQPAYDTPFTLRIDGHETVQLRPITPGIPAQQIIAFNPLNNDVLDLTAILNKTTAAPDLSNVASYITATTAGGNTTLSLNLNHTGGQGAAFATLVGVTTTVAQLMTDNALTFTPTPTGSYADPGMTFIYRPEGQESAILFDSHATTTSTPTQLQNFSLAGGDGIVIGNFMTHAHLTGIDLAHISDYLSTTQVGANTELWFDPTGSNHAGAGSLEAVFQNTSFTVSSLLAHGGIHLSEAG